MARRGAAALYRCMVLAGVAASLLVTGIAQAAPLPPLPPLPPLTGPAEEPPPAAEQAPKQPAVAQSDEAVEYAARVVSLTNDERAHAGCDAVVLDDRLTAAAQLHAQDMAEHADLSHVGSNGSTFDERIRAQGHPAPGAENVAYGYPDAATTVREWMGSPGHRTNIVNCTFVTIGVGFDPRGNFVAQEFGRPAE